MKGSAPFSEYSDQVAHTKPMGGASTALIRRQEAAENWVCFSRGNKRRPHILLSLLAPGLKGHRTLAVLK